MEEKEEFSFFPPSNGSCIGQLIFPAMDKNKKQKLKDKDKRTKINKQQKRERQKFYIELLAIKEQIKFLSYALVGESIAVCWLFRAMLRYRLAHIVHMICTVNSVLVSRF